MNATFTGEHAYDGVYPDWSPAGSMRVLSDTRATRAALLHAHPFAPEPERALARDNDALDAELAIANLDVRIAEHESGHFRTRNPSLWTGEAIFGVVGLMIRDFAPADARAQSVTARLNAIPTFLGAMRASLSGTVPNRWAARARRECSVADGLFDRGLTSWMDCSGINGAQRRDVDLAAARARTAFSECSAWLALHTGMIEHSEDDSSYACGEGLFRILLTRGHYCHEAPRDLLAQAEADLILQQSRLADMTEGIGATWGEAQEAMALDHPTIDEYLPTFARRWRECRARFVERDVVTWPDWPLQYAPIPAWAAEFAPSLYWLFYRSPAPLDAYTVYEYVVTPIDATLDIAEREKRLRAWNHSTITLNHVVHHGAGGHHVQNWHAYHRGLSRIGKIAAVDCANRIGMFLGGSMAEGWACYATELAEELALLTPLESLSQQHTRVRMLARAIIDIRLHLGDWTLSACIAFYQKEVGMAPEIAAGEATKNSMFPCTAIMYWLGTRALLDARTQERAARGDRYSARAFHDALLARGAIPALLAARIIAPETV